jgi:hypothetical protein
MFRLEGAREQGTMSYRLAHLGNDIHTKVVPNSQLLRPLGAIRLLGDHTARDGYVGLALPVGNRLYGIEESDVLDMARGLVARIREMERVPHDRDTPLTMSVSVDLRGFPSPSLMKETGAFRTLDPYILIPEDMPFYCSGNESHKDALLALELRLG